ncbi:MAG: signal recognition particle-docking protein FtsY [Deferrisomatales bacterium]|nr:signal recognition particle-docking protein FtsY [Deferrisomatales bacterium]
MSRPREDWTAERQIRGASTVSDTGRERGKRGFLGRLFRGAEPEEPAAPPPQEGERLPGTPQEGAGEEIPHPQGAEVRESAAEEPGFPGEEPGGETAADAGMLRAEEEPGGGEADRPGFFSRLRSGLSKTRQGFVRKIDRLLLGKKQIDEETLEALEEVLLTADLGVRTSTRLIQDIQERVSRQELTSPQALRGHLKKAIEEILVADEGHFELGATRPHVLLVVGVNGAGKTTTIGKIASRFRQEGYKVLLAAGDTFRAAAIEQLEIWGRRVGAPVVRHQHGSDPAAVAYDAVEAAVARGVDLLIVDTAGRLHTKTNLMEELKKVSRVIGKALPGAPHEVLLVLDATTGQNAIHQAKIFHEATRVDSIALTKLDGTAKGGVIVGICDELKIPVKFIGIGEKVEDLRPFDARAFVEALFEGDGG